jgi:hypothetical protein
LKYCGFSVVGGSCELLAMDGGVFLLAAGTACAV